MAYNTRGSRPITVAGMSFRWRVGVPSGQLVVWHVLDAGRLSFQLPSPRFSPTPDFVSRLVSDALSRGWRTTDHRHMDLRIEDLPPTRHALGQPEPIALPGIEDVLDHEAAQLGAPDLGSPVPHADAVLQCVFSPTFTPGCVLTLWTQADRGYVQLLGELDEQRIDRLAEADPDWIRDAIVSVRSAPPSEIGGVIRDGMPVRATVRDASGLWTATEPNPADGTAVRVAAQAAWHISLQGFATDVGALECIEQLHSTLGPGTLPFARDEVNRVLRLFGSWTHPEALLEVLHSVRGAWVVDSRRVIGFSAAVIDALDGPLPSRGLSLFWVTDPDQALPVVSFEDLDLARAARRLTERGLLVSSLDTLDSRHRQAAKEALLSSEPVHQANLQAERCLTEHWGQVPDTDGRVQACALNPTPPPPPER